MTVARVRTLVVLALVVGGLGWLLLDTWEAAGRDPLPVPWTAPAGIVVLAGVVLAAGREVRRWVAGRRTRPLDPLAAARIAVLSTASSYVGAVLAGWYAAQALVVLPVLLGDRRDRFVLSLVSSVASVGLAAAGLVAQRWCRRPPDEDEERSPKDL